MTERKCDIARTVTATVNGRPVRPQLMSEGELTDDICVVMEMAHRSDSVDDVLVSVQAEWRWRALKHFGLVALAIRLEGSGAVLYRQDRVGAGGRRHRGYRVKRRTYAAALERVFSSSACRSRNWAVSLWLGARSINGRWSRWDSFILTEVFR